MCSKEEAVDFLFKNTIKTEKVQDYFLGTELITRLSDTGLTEEEAVKKVKKMLLKHLDVVEKQLSEEKRKEAKMEELCKEMFEDKE
ncbi:hypothetical protein Mpsy_2273 [Methanolobus psychrophilus R15]|nr:hypothetical protein Mpsy_2273 [Methanolobus psychrophilus R15]